MGQDWPGFAHRSPAPYQTPPQYVCSNGGKSTPAPHLPPSLNLHSFTNEPPPPSPLLPLTFTKSVAALPKDKHYSKNTLYEWYQNRFPDHVSFIVIFKSYLILQQLVLHSCKVGWLTRDEFEKKKLEQRRLKKDRRLVPNIDQAPNTPLF